MQLCLLLFCLTTTTTKKETDGLRASITPREKKGVCDVCVICVCVCARISAPDRILFPASTPPPGPPASYRGREVVATATAVGGLEKGLGEEEEEAGRGGRERLVRTLHWWMTDSFLHQLGGRNGRSDWGEHPRKNQIMQDLLLQIEIPSA